MGFGFGCFEWWRNDPGPCIICGEPHTACTPETVAAKERAQRARANVALANAATAPEPDGVTFTTKSYNRKLHGPRAPKVVKP